MCRNHPTIPGLLAPSLHTHHNQKGVGRLQAAARASMIDRRGGIILQCATYFFFWKWPTKAASIMTRLALTCGAQAQY